MKIILKRVLTVLVIIVLVVPLFVYQSMNVAATGDLADTDILSESSVLEVNGELSGSRNEGAGELVIDDPVVVPDEDEPQSPSFNVEFGALSEDISFFGAEDNNEDAMDITLTWLTKADANRVVYPDGGKMLNLTPENNLAKTVSFQEPSSR